MPKPKTPTTTSAETVEQAMQSLIESLPDPALIMRPDGVVLNINGRFSSRFGLEPRACFGREIYGLITGELGIPVLAGYLKEKCGAVLASGEGMAFDDEKDTWKVSINPMRSSDGTISRLFMIVRDYSEQQLRDRELRRDSELKTALLEAIPCSAVILDEELSVMASNGYAKSLMRDGNGDGDNTPNEFFSADTVDLLKEKFFDTLRSGDESYCEMEVHPHKRDSSWLMARSRRIFIDGKPCLVSIGFDISERKRIEHELSRYKERLSMALDASHAGVWEWVPSTGEVDWSEEVWGLYGLDNTLGPPVLSLWEQAVHPEDRERGREVTIGAAERMADMEFEYRIPLADGSVRWLLSRGRAVPGGAGRADRYVGTVIDITERKQLELELQRHRAMMDQALDASRVGVWEVGLRSNFVRWSDTLLRLFGIGGDEREFSLERWAAVIHPEDREKTLLASRTAIGQRQEINLEYRVCHPDGSIHWVMSRGKPLIEKDGSIEHYIGSVIDITERKLLENELVESKWRFGYALDAAQTGIWEWNVVTDELNWSEHVWRLYGLKPASMQLNHQLCVDTIHPEDREMVSGIIRQAVLDGNAASVEYRTCYPDGSVHWLTSRGMPMYDEEGKLQRYIGAVIDITARKETELALLENKKRLGLALESARAGVWVWELASGENIWSDEIWPLYGIEHADGLMPSFELWARNIHPEDLQATIKLVNDAAASQEELYVEYRICHPDGSVRWLMSRGMPEKDEQGNAVRYLGTIIDITERKIAELALKESRFRFNFALEATRAGVWEWEIDGDKVTWSEQVWGLYGIDPHSIRPSHRLCESNVHKPDREEAFAQVMSAASHNESFKVEYRVEHPDGSRHWLLCQGVPLPDADGKEKCYIGTVMDVTDRKNSELLLRENEQKFRNIFDFSPIAIGIEDPENGLLYDVNPSWLRLFGYAREELLGKRVIDAGIFAHPEEHEQIAAVLHEQGRLSSRPVELLRKNGEPLIALVSAEVIVVNDQKRVLVMMTDITVQELQQASISQLERAVSERTEQLRQEVERLKRFLSMISHEYRTPLAIIRGNMDLIDMKYLAGNFSNDKEIAKIKRAIDRLVEVMEVSIQESRLLESPRSVPVEMFRIEGVIASQLEAFSSMWPERQVRSSGNLGESMAYGEQAQLKMAFFNLLDNARKYSAAGTEIVIGRHLEDGEAVVTIRNRGGSGVDFNGEELFEKYRRGSNAANTGGAGLGLWLVRNILEQHHGSVSIEATADGVEAVVRLPLAAIRQEGGAGRRS